MKNSDMKKTKPKKHLAGGCVVTVIALILFLVIFTADYYSGLNQQLFEERKLHLIEFTNKVSEVIDGVVDSSWKQLYACRHIVMNCDDLDSVDTLMGLLASTGDFLSEENAIVLAIDQDGNYYASDGGIGYWTESWILEAGANENQQEVIEIPHIPQTVFFLFLQHLAEPIEIRETGKRITHIAMAVDINSLKEQMSIQGFGEHCYSYIINEDGRRLYEYTYANNFIGGYNILRSIEEYPVVNGGTYEDLRAVLKSGENIALEFEYTDELTGGKSNWFVANSDIRSAGWDVLIFVPTDVLGANTNLLMHKTVRFFLVLAVSLVFLFCVMIFTIVKGRADKKMMLQQESANEKLTAALEEAKSASKAKSEFLSYMSHDIRTPINGIMGMTDIAVRNIANQERVLDCLNKIQSSSRHLLNLINDVLNMSRIESGKTEVGHAPFDMRICLANCASIVDGQLVDRELLLIREFEKMEHPLVIGDELHLRQVFINILGNAVKFTPDGGKIFFRAKEIGQENAKAKFHFEIEDTGVGMNPDFLPHLFEPFSQEDSGSRTTYKGTGLGMAITRQFMDLMGGTIQVESEPNVGTKFVMELSIDIDPETKAEETEHAVDIDLDGMKVLLVEDNELNLEIAQELLEEQNIIVTPAENGQLAVELFENSPAGTFDVILMDIMMPVMDGITATKIIRGLDRPDAKTIPIVAMTANAYDEDVKKTKEAGMNAHMTKPVDQEMLLKTLGNFYFRKHEKPDFTGKTVLLAEDNELNFEIAKEILEEEGLTVVRAKNGQLAVETFQCNPPGTFDIILMDMNMPVMNGITATKMIRGSDREDAQTIPVVALTADTYDEDIQKTKAAGMNGYLTKPFDMDDLITVLTECLNDQGEKDEYKK